MISIRKLRNLLWEELGISSKKITIKRKKKMILENMSNGNVKAVRKNYLKIEIIE